ncbi:Na+/H+ antiporter subunit D [Dinoroseobacter sp. PD6]|nr:Na+/H+ antiporter subunit D [Dinoroseobacter sp. PD6]MDD9718263.1 Na+/H+ antiporter subunit D [Dinoroseobacter sp. PD6]
MILVWPIVIPMITAVITLLLRKTALAYHVSLLGSVALLGSGLILLRAVLTGGPMAAQMGGWEAPFGITLFADILSAAMVVIAGIVAVAVIVYSRFDVTEDEKRVGFHALSHALLVGVCGAFLTGDIFNLYVWFEVMLIASFGLLVIGGRRDQIDAAVKYVGLNLVATLAFLTGVGILYGAAGTLNMADLHLVLADRQSETAVLASAALLLFAFGAKAAMFPVFAWLPASYHTPAFATSALFAALLTKVGVYALLRVFTVVYDGGGGFIQPILLIGAVLTMVIGVLGAAAQNDVRRILSFHIISQIGYMVLGLALFTPLAIIGAIFYLFHHIIVKANLFFVAGLIKLKAGSEELDKIGGLLKASPLLAILFLIPALSLAGIPPLSGFWAKFIIVQASLEARDWWVALAALAVGLITLFSMTKIWLAAFWKDHPDAAFAKGPVMPRSMTAPIAVLAVMTVIIGLGAGPLYTVAEEAAITLLDPLAYVEVVLGPEVAETARAERAATQLAEVSQ